MHALFHSHLKKLNHSNHALSLSDSHVDVVDILGRWVTVFFVCVIIFPYSLYLFPFTSAAMIVVVDCGAGAAACTVADISVIVGFSPLGT